jgi:hypothetical protein
MELACVYFDHKQEFKAAEIMRSILKQIVRRKASISEEILKLYKKHSTRGTPPILIDMAAMLQKEIRHCMKIFLVLDALNECPTSRHTINRILEELKKLQSTVHVLITGRPFAVSNIHRFENSWNSRQ